MIICVFTLHGKVPQSKRPKTDDDQTKQKKQAKKQKTHFRAPNQAAADLRLTEVDQFDITSKPHNMLLQNHFSIACKETERGLHPKKLGQGYEANNMHIIPLCEFANSAMLTTSCTRGRQEMCQYRTGQLVYVAVRSAAETE